MSSPEVRGYPIGACLPDLSPPPTATSPWKHELQSTCSEDSALHSDSDNIQEESLVARVRKQLEYYFSLENLATDQYLISQMDGDQFVPIWTVANFNAVKKLTTDIEVIKGALHSSTEVQIDSTGSKVRPVIKRCTLILRDISQHATAQEIAALFNNSPDCPPCIKCTFAHNNSWFVEFRTEHEALQAYSYFREHPHYFHGDLIKVRIKARPIQRSSPTDSNPVTYNSSLYQANMPCYPTMLPMMWMSPSGMVPMDLTQGGYSNSVPDFQEFADHRYRVRSADSANYSNRRKPRRNNNSRSSNWKHSDFNNRDSRYSRSNMYHRHKRNDSDDSSTVSSASSYNVPPSKHGFNKSPAVLNNTKHASSSSPSSNKQPASGKHPQNKPAGQNKPANQFTSNRQTLNNHKKVSIKQPQQPLEKEIVPSKIQRNKQTDNQTDKQQEKHIDLEPSQFPPLSSNSAPGMVKVNNAWCKRTDKSADPSTPKSDKITPSPRTTGPSLQSPRSQVSGRGGGAAGRGPKHGTRAPQFRTDFFARGARRGENHASADMSVNWRRNPATKPIRGMRPMRKPNKNPERRETDFIPDVNVVPIPDSSGRPTYSEIAAKVAAGESDPPPLLCNGNAASSSEDDSASYRKTFSEVIASQQRPPSNPISAGDRQTKSRSESSEHSGHSPTTPKNKADSADDVWTRSKYRNSRPKNVNLRNVYRLETKLNDLDISEPVFPKANSTEMEREQSLDKEDDHVKTPSSDVITPRNIMPSWGDSKPFKAAINWFDDDEDDFLEDTICTYIAEQEEVEKTDLPNDIDSNHVQDIGVGADSNPASDMVEPVLAPESTTTEDFDTQIENIATPDTGNDVSNITVTQRESHPGIVDCNGTELEERQQQWVSTVPEPEIFLLEEPSKCDTKDDDKVACQESCEEAGSPQRDGEAQHDSEYDSDRDEFFSSYCESPGWE